ncbi:hypothetical protein HanRHA438_Chr12g0573491 [Helianthus annuus]|uniref:Uncharacterized protein n=1 Tax=Helianthus annuus TaxID=4232 RepID=A0A9K3HK74_HELAN|nr:hypothetical protein HanXRQr2_Chr12g0562271 [Helianthus annuus]KAJ0864415.1 hypothetical protein HanPSC8_Chr12g0541741 [Helianthus annuus]KAJ0868337.1 hypothetical protein HanRHA438_Chr12g0573491 [Helianthus annuus]
MQDQSENCRRLRSQAGSSFQACCRLSVFKQPTSVRLRQISQPIGKLPTSPELCRQFLSGSLPPVGLQTTNLSAIEANFIQAKQPPGAAAIPPPTIFLCILILYLVLSCTSKDKIVISVGLSVAKATDFVF